MVQKKFVWISLGFFKLISIKKNCKIARRMTNLKYILSLKSIHFYDNKANSEVLKN